MRSRHTHSTARPGFTLLELLIAVGIIGVLASVVIVAISPKKSLLAARDAERAITAKQVQNAMFQYQIDHNGDFLGDDGIGKGAENAVMICAQGVTGNSHCINLDGLAPTYIAKLPKDFVEPCPDYTGYLIDQNNGFIEVTALHKGKMPGDPGIIVTPGCSAGTSGASSASSSSSSSSTSQVSSAASSAAASMSSSGLSSSASAAASASSTFGQSSASATASSSFSSLPAGGGGSTSSGLVTSAPNVSSTAL